MMPRGPHPAPPVSHLHPGAGASAPGIVFFIYSQRTALAAQAARGKQVEAGGLRGLVTSQLEPWRPHTRKGGFCMGRKVVLGGGTYWGSRMERLHYYTGRSPKPQQWVKGGS